MTLEADAGFVTHPVLAEDATAANPDEARALGAAWANSWPGSNGKGYRVIGCEEGVWPGFDFPYQFPGNEYVVLKAKSNNWTPTAKPVTTTGIIDLGGSRNVCLFRWHLKGGRRIRYINAENLWLNRCWFEGSDVRGPEGEWTSDFAMRHIGSEGSFNPGLRWTGCVFEKFTDAAFWIGVVGNNQILEDSDFYDHSSDDWKTVGAPADCIMRRNMLCRNKRPASAAHCDGWQINNDNASPRAQFYENICAKGTFFQNDGKIIQCLWGGGAGLTSGHLYQNFFQTKAVNGFRVTGDTTGSLVEYNDLHGLVEQLTDIPNIGGFSDRRYNFACGDGNASTGTGGLEIDIRGGTGAADPYWEEGFPEKDASLYDLLAPASGQATHWDFGGQKVGAWQLKKHKLVDGGAHIGENWGWPRAQKFRDTWNFDDKISTSFNGQLDSEGNNASGAPVPTFPVISISSQITVTV